MTSAAQRLRQKLLDLAIHGKLVPQDPKDEPASELLARIRDTREGRAPARPGGKGDRLTRTRGSASLPIPEEEIPFDLPKGWVWCRLMDIAEIQLGKMLDAEKNKGKPFRYLANVSVRWGSFDVDNLKTTLFTDDEIEKFALKQGDLLMCEGGVPGRCAVWRECDSEIKYQKALHRIRPYEVLPDYLQMYFEAIYQRPFFTERFTGSTIHHLPREVLMSVPVPLPPLAEQKRIVEKLNAMLNEAARVAEGTERLTQLRKKARAKILDLAIRGKLVKQEKTDEPAAELLKRIATEKAKLIAEKKIKKEKPLPPIADDEIPFDLPKGWAWARIGDISSGFMYGTAEKSQPAGAVPVLRMGNLQDGEIDFADLVFTSNKEDIKTYALTPGDLLFNRTNSDEKVGKVSIFRENRPCIYAGYLVRFRPLQCDSEYINYVMNSHYQWTFCQSVKSDAVNQSNISASKFVRFLVPIPPLAEQRRIVAKVKEMLSACDVLKKGD